MNRHQVLTGAANAGDHCCSVGSVEGVPFTAYASGCNIVILASDFQRVQIIPGIAHGNVQVCCLDCSTDVGKIAAAYGKEVCIFEPTPLFSHESVHKLDYQWVQTAAIATDYHVQVLSWNLAGSRLLTGGSCIQLWQLCLPITEENTIEEEPTVIQVSLEDGSVIDKNEQYKWDCIWKCKTAQPVTYLKFSPDGTLFASAGSADRLVKIWYSNKVVCFSSQSTASHIKYTFIYIAHPRAITGLSWRKTSKFMPRDSVANMLVTSCRDNICRVWVQTLVPEDGLVNFQQIEALVNETPRAQTQRHRRKIMQRLKHMKSMNQYKRRQATQFVEDPNEVVPTLPSTYSVHDFHSFGLQGSGITPGLHFHLAASINAETDIPLVPRLNGGCSTKEPNFVVHWLNNKEMEFTHAAEHLLQDVSTKVLHTEKDNTSNHTEEDGAEDTNDVKLMNGPKSKKIYVHSESQENLETEYLSKRSSSNASSSTSISTDISISQIQNHSGDFLDRKIELLLRDWHRSPDLLFSVYPADGSFLVWLVDWLDEYNPGAFRQAQISFASRIPNAVPLGDACTMSHYLYLYSPHAGLDLRMALSPSFSDLQKEKSCRHHADDTESTDSSSRRRSNLCTCAHSSSTPIICMLSKHHNGSLNLWHMTFGENSNHTQVLSICHGTRVCGHRFRINDVSCHPVLPLLLTTSHHNLPSRAGSQSPSPSIPSSPCCQDPSVVGLQAGFCSELILWKVEPVGPLSKSGGITELARINSLETAAFANVAWIPTLLPSTTQGSISNSPSACFVASDGHQLRIYQAVIDARALLAEMSLSSRRKSTPDMSQSSSSSSGLGYRPGSLHEAFKIVSEQSTSRPGCVIELDSICDATHDWQNTMLLHVFQEQLITSSPVKRFSEDSEGMGLVQPDLQAIVDLRHSSVFEEPFYLVVLEKQEDNSVMHMWRMVIASQIAAEEQDKNLAYVPDSNIVQGDHSNHSSRSQTPEPSHDHGNHLPQVSPLRVTTTKVCTQTLLLPSEVEIVHATPAAGHLSSSNIYPACYAPYLICTACSDSTIRFWKCDFSGSSAKLDESSGQYNWIEWEMMLNNKCSSIQISGQPLYVSCAYSGRMACAYKFGRSFTKHAPEQSGRFINVSIAIFECESTGGSEWVLEDTINLKNIGLPQANLGSNLNLDTLYDASQKNRRTAEVLIKKITTEDLSNNHGPPIQRLLSVPSYTTLQTLRLAIIEQGNQCVLTQKSLVQLDWASAEDGSHILTVAISSKILLFTPVSNDIAQANVQAMKASKSASRPLLKQASSMVLPLSCNDEIRWMRIRSTYLKTADSLPPLPMHCSWVRHGILVVGMDNEMHIYSQWRAPAPAKEEITMEKEKDDNIPDGRKLTEEELLSKAQEISQLRLPAPSGTLSRSTSSTILNVAAETKKKKTDTPANKSQLNRDSLSSLGPMPDFGLFEACRLACPVLPQYHPKQLMELLGFGKLRRVKAILSHLVRCLSGTDCIKKTYLQVRESTSTNDAESEGGSGRSWSRTRAMSLAANSSPLQHSPMDPQGSLSLFPEEVTLDYVEIQSIPPLPLFTLLAADNEKTNQATVSQNCEGAPSDQDYTSLFDTTYEPEENLDEILHDKIQLGGTKRDRPSISGGNEQKLALTYFSPRQATLLTRFLTHSHLPGLSSLDQMHLLALADTVASFNTALADRFGTEISMPKEQAKAQMDGLNVQITTDSLDDCGLHFLLAMRHYTYLLRCLPLVQRAQLQNQGLGSHSLVWAFHSETQEELLQLVPCIPRGNPKWSELKELGVGWWVRSNTVLRKLMEKVAKAAFQANNDPLDAALFYLAMKKKTLVWGLFRSIHDTRMTEFFRNNFSEDKWRKAALKNAFALMGKQRFEHAAAFFLLAGALDDAVDVCLNKLDDLQLAMVVVRLYEGEIETVTPALRKILFEGVLGCEKDGSNYIPSQAHPDPFLRCMARWILQDYCGSLTTLLQTDVGYSHPKATEAEMNATDRTSANPSVFNFYLFLRMHALVVRRQKHKNRPNIIPAQFSKDIKDSEVPYEDAISPLERRLFFTTSHAHFRAGCPALALEVLSRLPCHVASDGPMSPDDAVFDFANVLNGEDKSIVTGIFDSTSQTKIADTLAFVATVQDTSSMDFDWGAPISKPMIEEPLELKFNDSDSGSENGLEMKTENIQNDTVASDEKSETQLDIMAQQLKFIACLKIMMEELSTLATGFEADGGQLRYQLYIWLERSVAALKDLCNYGCSNSNHSSTSTVTDDTGMGSNEPFSPRTSSHIEDSSELQTDSRPSLHEILLADKLDFETKLQRASRRKEWLKANEALLRTLLSYCSLHGALGGGLAAVRIELIFLLHELQQERSQQQLLSPLPFPTTLPLLTASVACQKTVVADPIRHLQALAHDILLTIVDMTEPPTVSGSTFSCVVILRDLSTSLSACLYESLCDSDTFIVKQSGGHGLSMETFLSSGVVYQNSHLLAGHMRHRQFRNKGQSSKVTTAPNKWPGVHSLRALLAQDKDEDSPKLHTLLCEAFVAVYLSQLIHAVATCDCHVLYRLVGQQFSKDTWAALFGGGARMLLHVSNATQSGTPPVTPASSLEKDSILESGSSLFDSFSRQRIKLHMKFLGNPGQNTSQPEIKDGKPTYREQFIPPQMSMVSLLMTKAQLPPEWVPLDYDSNESLPSDDDIEDEQDVDDVFGESQESSSHPATIRKKIVSDSGGLDQLDPSSYTWGIIRYAIVKLAHRQLFHFLNVAGIEIGELPVTSPLLHAAIKSLEAWLKYLKSYMDSFDGPPPNYIPGCYVENTKSGPAILKYKALLELHNTPFRSNRRVTMPVKRLWNFLVRQEMVQDIFIRYIFKRKPLHFQGHEVDHGQETGTTPDNVAEPIRILHKNQDTISTFCISNVTKGFVALATLKEIQELNVSVLLEPIPWLENEAEYDVINLLKPAETLPCSDYLVVQHPLDKVAAHSGPNSSYNSPTGPTPPPLGGQSTRNATVMKGHHFPGSSNPHFCQFVTERSRHMLKPLSKHKIDGVRKLASHPLMPVYLSGSQDGSVHLWEWSHPQRLLSPRPSGTFAKVTRILFNLQGNKFGVTDGDGNISLWQAGLSSISNKPFFSAQCHNKNASDFAFVGSSSLIATSGYSSDNKNVCIWDTLLPHGKSLVESFTCHDHGSSAMSYATQNQVLITAGKRGDICIFDVRQRQLRHKFTAHDSAIKCLALDPGEEFFATGSVDGDIKVWGLNMHVKLYSFTGEHTKSTLFRNVSNGVSQMEIDEDGRLFSCGADGSLKMRTLPDRDLIVNAIVQ